MYRILGFVNIALVVIITSPYWLRLLNTKLLHIKSPGFNKFLMFLRPLHKVLAVVLLVLAPLHGYLALGAIRLHTGLIVSLGFYTTALLGLLFYFIRKPALLKVHRAAAVVSVGLVIIHLVVPNLFNTM